MPIRVDPKNRLVRFLVPFLILCGGGLWSLQHPWMIRMVWRAQVIYADLLGRSMNLIGYPARVEGSEVHLDRAVVKIIDEYTGVYAMILLGSFLISYPLPWRRRLIGLGAAAVFVSVVNLLRLVGLTVLLVEAPDVGKFAHDYIWQVVWGSALVAFALVAVSSRHPAGVTSDGV